MTDRRLDGRVAIVTGGGGGLGRSHALALARLGARVVVNDYGGSVDGVGADPKAARAVVDEIKAAGGEAVADGGDVGAWKDAEALVARALETFGDLDILVNNAGILRPKTIVGMSESDVADVLRVHLIGTFAVTHFSALHWRDRFKASGKDGARLINTTSSAGLYSAAQANYAAAKAGIAAFTGVAANELVRYGATSNAISPTAVTRMSEGIAPENFTVDHATTLLCWLASPAAQDVTGRVFNVGGGHISVVDRWHTGAAIDKSEGWSIAELDSAVPALIARATPHPDVMGYRPGDERSPLMPKIELPRGDKLKSEGEKS